MCGICGVLNLDGKPAGAPELQAVENMLAAMHRRGPDSKGTYIDGPLAMGTVRLAINDLRSVADQPLLFQYRQKNFPIVFNGEIYNFLHLRRDLEKQGVTFKTNSDTEVLAAMFAIHGGDCLVSLRGMFAFAVWNQESQSLFLARDRLGEKPLVYYQDQERFIFASDLPALLASNLFPREINPVGIHLALHLMAAPAPHSPYKGVKKLPTATQLLVKGAKSESRRYWRLDFSKDPGLSDPLECAAQVRSCLDQTVALMCQADVPVGATLSGGLDSSAVVSAMAPRLGGFNAFRIASQTGRGRLESHSARAVAQRYGIRLNETILEPHDLNGLREIAALHGEPISTIVALDALLLSSHIKQSCTVALCGGGADELFGGYKEHYLVPALLKAVSDNGDGQSASDASQKKELCDLFKRIGQPAPEQLMSNLKYGVDRPPFNLAYGPALRQAEEQTGPGRILRDSFRESGAENIVDALMWQHLTLLCQYSLVDLYDRAGMAHSLEFRSPFLDVRMVELAARMPVEQKACAQADLKGCKQALRLAMQDRLPPNTLNLPKTGFGSTVPYADWFWNTRSELIEERLNSEKLLDSGLFDHGKLQELILLNSCGVNIPIEAILGPIMVGLWLEEFF